jgi:anti-sigma B factor antagonist
VRVDIHQQGDSATVVLVGELDESNVADAERRALAAAHVPGVGELVLDLADLTFMDSTGIAMLMRLERDARRRGHRLLLMEPSEAVRGRLDRTGLLSMLALAERPRRGAPS